MGRYIPDTSFEQEEMLKEIGLTCVDDLYHMVPKEVYRKDLKLPEGKTEMEVSALMKGLAAKNQTYHAIFRGAGSYWHYIPAIVKTVTSKEEFLTAYTPYQAEISQGVLQSIFEYQTQITELTGHDVSNASVYDGAVAAAEGVLMCLDRKRNEVLVSEAVDPEILTVVKTYLESRSVPLTVVKAKDGLTDEDDLKEKLNEKTAAFLVQSPNALGLIEDVETLTKLTHEAGAKAVESVNPISLGLLRSPGEMDVDVAVGEGQPLGLPMSFGGPYLGFMTCKKEMMRKLPGRIVGQTHDKEGRRAFVLTLQAREQHIRREKASSNICSNEALCAMTASVYLASLGQRGLEQVAANCVSHAHYLKDGLAKLGFTPVYEGEFFHEFLTDCPCDPEVLEEKLAAKGILIGKICGKKILWCATELCTKTLIDELFDAVKEVLA
ncbi:MAG: aminomethyl-transferring glycine dehydrogenase subunit GcvPA [Erysipelotrichaceae bacterium]|nr:aminomethyl-transferring glycine dehydrogenase subunit GcvPA [Erysipelotrichaceae bacterium]